MTQSLADLARRAAKHDPQIAALRIPAARGGGRNLVTIASGKGGVGKTWFAITLSHALARYGRRTLLFDGDLGLANVDIQLGLMPKADLGMVIAGTAEMADVIHRFDDPGNAKSGFDIIAGRSGSGLFGRLKPQTLADMRDGLVGLANAYDHVILDLAAGVDAGVTTLADHDGMTIVVATPDPTSLTDAYAFIKLHRQRRPDGDIRIVVNQANDIHDGKRTYEGLKRASENFLKFTPPLLGIVRRDRNVTQSIRQQAAMLHRHAISPAAEDVVAIAEKLSP